MSSIDQLDALDIPVQFLEGYPLAAIVVECTQPDITPTVERSSSSPSPDTPFEELSIVWSNKQWQAFSGTSELRTALDHRSYALVHSANSSQLLTLSFNQPHVALRFAKSVHTPPSSSTAPCSSFYILTCLEDTTNLRQNWRRRSSPAQRISSPSPFFLGPATPSTFPPSHDASSRPSFTLQTTDCRQLLEITDWSNTSLGPRATWSPVVETMISVIMASPTQDALWLGPDFNMIYNQNYSNIVHHPLLFGKSAKVKEAWGPVWDSVSELIDRCLTLGESCHRVDDLLLYRRGPKGHFVEKYHTWSFVPIFDTDGKTPLGLFNPTVETTDSVLAKRRQETLRDLSEQSLLARTQEEYWRDMPIVLATNTHDVPFAACYSLIDSAGGKVKMKLVSKVGIPDNHPSTPNIIETVIAPAQRPRRPNSTAMSSPSLSAISAPSIACSRIWHSDDKSAWPIARALATRQCIVIDDCSELVAGFPLRQWDALPDSAVVIPFCGEASSSMPTAVMVLGLNLQCPFDSDYEDWVFVLRAHLTSSLSSVKAIEAEQARILETERMAKAKTAWFQGAAHDLRSPLTLVAGPLDDVLRTKLTPQQKHWLTIAQRNVSRIQRLVNALLDFSRLEAGRLNGHFAPIDLNRFVTELATFFEPAAEKKKITLTISAQPFPGTVSVDPVLLETVVTNLLSNAIKYTESGSIRVDVLYDSHVYIIIADTGCGIPKAELSHVTDRYHRATTALNTGVEGTGIGLALTQEIVKLHGGELLIESQVAEESGKDHGSIFTVKIPLVDRLDASVDAVSTKFGAYGRQLAAEAMYQHAQDDTSSNLSLTDNSTMDGTDKFEGLFFEQSDVLLLADDSADIRDYIRRIFAPLCKVIEAKDGREALELAKEYQPNLILSDMMMPKMNGQELLAAIRADPTTRSIPMVLLSAATDEELRVSAMMDYSAEDFLLKPFKPKELVARVNLHMQMGKRRIYLESQFAQREQELRLLSDYCPSGIIRSDAAGNLIYVNPVWREYCGMSPEEDMNNWPEYVDEATRDRLKPIFDRITFGETKETSVTWKWLNGKTVTGTFLRLDKVDSGMKGVLGCLQDITYQEEKLFEAERRRIEAEEAKRQQEMLVDMTSHEIRTPVSAILQCSALVRDNLDGLRDRLKRSDGKGYIPSVVEMEEIERDLDALDSIYQCGLVQERIANDILSLARVQLDTLTLHHATTNLRASARQTISAFASEARTKSIQLSLEFGESISKPGIEFIKTDHVRLGQVVTNLIANAIRFTGMSKIREIGVKFDLSFVPPLDSDCAPPEEGYWDSVPEKSVKEGTMAWLFVSVRDTGPGLSEKEQTRLFKRFSQGNEMIHSQYGGSGLGLFICRKISELLGGRIEVKSQLGKGSVFRFFIQTWISAPPVKLTSLPPGKQGPLNVMPDPDSTVKSQPSTPLEEGKTDTMSLVEDDGDSREHSVLIVEDNIINQTVLKRQLSKKGWNCDVANDGQEALDNLYNRAKERAPPYDVILMDLEMPVMNGIACVKEIRKAEARGDIVYQLVIALTGNARQGQIDQALQAGMDDVVIKPYRLPELLKKMRGLIEIGREEIEKGRKDHGGDGVNGA